MAYGPGDNAFVIDRPTSEGGDSVERAMQKTQAQFDALYDDLNTDIGPASENTRGLIRLASQSEVNAGAEDAAAVTPKTLANSELAAKVAANSVSALELAQSESAMQQAISSASNTADEALEKAKQASTAAAQAADIVDEGMEYPTDATFKAMPALEPYDATGTIDNRRKLKLPSGGKWIYCGALTYHWQESGTSEPGEGDMIEPLCGIGDGGSVIWHSTMTNHGADIAYSQTFGFVWKMAAAS